MNEKKKIKKLYAELMKDENEFEKRFPPIELKSDGKGGIVLDPSDPVQREWYENEEAYGGLVDEEK